MSRPALLLCCCLVACDRGEPPKGPATAGDTAAATSSPKPHRRLQRPRVAPSASAGAPAPDAAPAADASADAGAANQANAEAPAEPALTPPPLLGTDGKPLPQTEDEPKASSPWFEAAVRALFRAIQTDDPKSAEAFFFPLVAYEQVKDVKDPKRDWEHRLMRNFRRDIHDYHKRLGPRAREARFVGVDLAKERLKWMKPRSEGNRLGYFRVTRNRLRYETAEGKPATLEVTSLISWRGEWFLVHLNGFE